MEKIVSKKARQLARVLQDIYKSIIIEDQSTLQTALQLYFVFQLNTGLFSYVFEFGFLNSAGLIGKVK
jgi:hypothetical protein